MAYIDLQSQLPGIAVLLKYRSDTGYALNQLLETLWRATRILHILGFFRRMPAGHYPLFSDGDCYLVVQLQGNNSCSTADCASYNFDTIFAPFKMSRPLLFSGVE